MFGYVRAYKPELKCIEYDTYKSVYCSLCRQLHRDYGIFAKFILSYDFTFLAMLRLGIRRDGCSFEKKHCTFNPAKRCYMLCNGGSEMKYSAACAVILFYHKLRDNIRDGGFFSKLGCGIILPLFAHYRKKAAKLFPETDKNAEQMMLSQNKVESDKSPSLDVAAEPTARMLQHMFSYGCDDEIQKRILDQLGYNCGKWIYLIDALDDLDKDISSGDYNPAAVKYSLYNSNDESRHSEATENMKAVINSSCVEAAADFELLDFNRYKPILGNILYLGLPEVVRTLCNGKNAQKDTPIIGDEAD